MIGRMHLVSRLLVGVVAAGAGVGLLASGARWPAWPVAHAQGNASVPDAGGAANTASGPTPRTPSGRPDLSGPWSFATLTPLERPKEFADRATLTPDEAAAIEQRAAETRFEDRAPRAGDPGTYNRFWTDFGSTVVGDRRTSLVIDPPDGRIPPITDAARVREDAMWARRQAAAKAQDLPTWDRCIVGFNAGPPIIPSGYNNNIQIFQTDAHVAILTEMVHEARVVPVDGRPHLPDSIRLWLGDSRGRWEGDTLVVETTNFSDKGTGTLVLDRQFGPRAYLGGIADAHLKLTEHFTRTDAHTLVYEFTVNDPTVWTRPWTVSTTMRRTGDALYEYACHEGNYGLAGMLSSARAEEKAGKRVAR